jgi:hypothetical protein
MKRRFAFQLVAVLGLLVAAVLWILATVAPEAFGWFKLATFVAVVTGFWGVAVLIDATTDQSNSLSVKKAKIVGGAVLLIFCVLAIVWTALLPAKIILPLIMLVIACAFMFSVFILKGRKWDEGDNKKEGYKNYYQRKEEAAKKAAELKEDKEQKGK